MLISDRGTLVRTSVAEVRVMGRNTQGVRLIRLIEGESLVGLQRVDENVGSDDDSTDDSTDDNADNSDNADDSDGESGGDVTSSNESSDDSLDNIDDTPDSSEEE